MQPAGFLVLDRQWILQIKAFAVLEGTTHIVKYSRCRSLKLLCLQITALGVLSTMQIPLVPPQPPTTLQCKHYAKRSCHIKEATCSDLRPCFANWGCAPPTPRHYLLPFCNAGTMPRDPIKACKKLHVQIFIQVSQMETAAHPQPPAIPRNLFIIQVQCSEMLLKVCNPPHPNHFSSWPQCFLDAYLFSL